MSINIKRSHALFARDLRPSFSFKERSIRKFLMAMSFLGVGTSFAILLILFSESLEFFKLQSPWSFLTGTRWEPFGEVKQLGVLPLLAGTLQVAVASFVIAVPIGVATAVYLTQYAQKGILDVMNPIIEILGGIPTVVYGYFALTTVTPLLREFSPFSSIEVFNALSASIVVGIAILPMISSLSIDAFQSVPSSIYNAAYAVGMRRFHVVTRVIMPAAASGVAASFILAFSRAIGETMAVTLAAGATPGMHLSYLKSIQTMTAFIVQISLGDTPAYSIEYYTIYAIGLTLFLLTFSFNYAATLLVRRFRNIY